MERREPVTRSQPGPTRPPYTLRRAWRERRDVIACSAFVLAPNARMTLAERVRLVRNAYAASFTIDSPHRQEEILTFVKAILAIPPDTAGGIVEAGCYKGSSTAKFSLAAAAVGRELVVFDSFCGLPENDEPHDRNIFGRPESFQHGEYCGTLEEVTANVSRFGAVMACRFVPGWFADTLPAFREPVAAAYMDVDLAASTRECIKHLYPLLRRGGVLYSQDGHLPLVIEVLDDDRFWERDVGCRKPRIRGLGTQKLIAIVKETV